MFLSSFTDFLGATANFGTLFLLIVSFLVAIVGSVVVLHKVKAAQWILWLVDLVVFIIAFAGSEADQFAPLYEALSLANLSFGGIWFLVSMGITIAMIVLFLVDIVRLAAVNRATADMSVEGKILAYLSPSFRLLSLTPEFFHYFGDVQDWQKTVDHATYDHQDLALKDFPKAIGADAKPSFHAEFFLKDGKSFALEGAKKVQRTEGRTTGYAIVASGESLTETYKLALASEAKKQLYVYLDLLDQPVAFFDHDKNVYVLTKSMAMMVNAATAEISPDEFASRIVESDRASFRNPNAIENVIRKFYTRITTVAGEKWLETDTLIYDGARYEVLTLADFKKNQAIFLNKKDLGDALARLDAAGKPIRLLGIHLANLPDIAQETGHDATSVLISEFFVRLVRDRITTSEAIFTLSSLDYALLFDDADAFASVLADLSKNYSEIVKMTMLIGNHEYTLMNQVVALDSAKVTIDGLTAITVLEDNLKIAQSQGKSYREAADAAFALDESLSREGIDMSDDYVDSLLKK